MKITRKSRHVYNLEATKGEFNAIRHHMANSNGKYRLAETDAVVNAIEDFLAQ